MHGGDVDAAMRGEMLQAAVEAASEATRRYINRLSDLLFILGRVLNRAGGRGDVLWQKGKTAA